MRGSLLASMIALAAMAAADGKVLYETKCAACHGKDGVAKPPGKGSRSFNDPAFQAQASMDAIADITAQGKGKMPGYRSKLTPEQIQAVAAHVKTLGPTK
jgi:mono/diheme cytochrome c family protein